MWRATAGYSARPLKGIWAAAPYLHNGSVPTLWDLLQPASGRPACFQLPSREFDPVHVGYVTVVGKPAGEAGSPCGAQAPLQLQPSSPWEFWVDTSLSGNLRSGHEGERYGTTLPDDDRWDLLEYLKTL